MNNDTYNIRLALPEDAKDVGLLVNLLLCELSPENQYDKEKLEHIKAAGKLIEAELVYALLAFDPDKKPVGVCTLYQGAAIYAHGIFGEISEFYIATECRSKKLGALLIDAAKEFGRTKGW